MKILRIVTFLMVLFANPAYANYGITYHKFGDFMYFSDGYWQIIHQEAIIDAYGFQFVHIGE